MTSLSCELSKQLKDAGWPQGGHNAKGEFVYENYADLYSVSAQYNKSYSPSLSELIEACGDRFWDMTRIHDSLW